MTNQEIADKIFDICKLGIEAGISESYIKKQIELQVQSHVLQNNIPDIKTTKELENYENHNTV